MSNMKVVRTLVCPDGVIGLNGWQYLLDKDDDYCWGIVKGFEVEMGSFSMEELKSMQPRLQRDLYFEPMKAKDVWEQLNKGEWV